MPIVRKAPATVEPLVEPSLPGEDKMMVTNSFIASHFMDGRCSVVSISTNGPAKNSVPLHLRESIRTE